MTWSHDMSAAPRGKMVTRNIMTMKGERTLEDHAPDFIWAASKCGKVIKSYWVPPTRFHDGYWAGFATDGGPLAWQLFVVPEHPGASL